MSNFKYISLIFLILGIGISGYLTYVKLTDTTMICVENDIFDCGKVQNSKYADIEFPLVGELPIALMGFLVYLILTLLTLTYQQSSSLA